ncbi:hypothetical protein MLD38_036496 [Melastoma candidum]|uniref:Uncharacterized protein n=1 Tax=Melastoma candidum TaxID=119954 RepID=A0ACB9LLR2_9MYRT|nr:hypothetical protein MLD38_036496 [Melastoma candidum]
MLPLPISLPRKPSCCYIADDEEGGGGGGGYRPPAGACDRNLDDLEAGFSMDRRLLRPWSFVNGYAVRGSSSFVSSSPRFVGRTRFFDEEEEEEEEEAVRRRRRSRRREEPHFLDSCFLCDKPLGNNSDIFMYRGDTPFCSEECRQEQMELDRQREMNLNLSSSVRALRNKEQQQEGRSTSPSKSPDSRLRTGTVAVA